MTESIILDKDLKPALLQFCSNDIKMYTEPPIFPIEQFISHWQDVHDSNFKPIPNDDHYKIVFNFRNKIYTYVFSNKELALECISEMSQEILAIFDNVRDDTNCRIYYKAL